MSTVLTNMLLASGNTFGNFPPVLDEQVNDSMRTLLILKSA